MKETIKASIGGYAFTLDVEAYEALKTYLDNLKIYFQNKTDGQEIIFDIEARMSELLQLKAKSGNEIITLSDAENIIEIMGNPAEFSDEESTVSVDKEPMERKKDAPRFEKKLYRDMDNAVIAGVCSGLGQYFRVDPVIIRVAYIIAIIASNKVHDKIGALLVIAYFVLWIVVPKAKTIIQKIAMSGQDPSIEEIETTKLKSREMRGSGFGKAIKKLFIIVGSAFLYIIGIGFLLSAIFTLFFPAALDLPSVKDFLEANGLYTMGTVTSLILLWLIPCFMIIYLPTRLLINFSRRDFAILAICFLVWIGVCGYMSIRGVKFAKDYQNEATYTEKIIPSVSSETVYLKLDEYAQTGENILDSKEIYLIDGEPKSWFILPLVEIKKDSIYKQIEFEIEKKAFHKSTEGANKKARNSKIGIKEQGTDIIITPHIYNKNNLWDREIFKIIVYCPIDKNIVVEEPLKNRVKSVKDININL